MLMLFVAAIGEQEQNGQLGNPAREEGEILDAGIVGPVNIFGDEQERPFRAESGKQMGERLEETSFLLFGAEFRCGRSLGQIRGEFWQQPHKLGGVRLGVAHQGSRRDGGEQRA